MKYTITTAIEQAGIRRSIAMCTPRTAVKASAFGATGVSVGHGTDVRVRSNGALIVADAQPPHPPRGQLC